MSKQGELDYRRCLVGAIAVGLIWVTATRAQVPRKHHAVLKTHCFVCHDTENALGGVNLEHNSFELDTRESAELWQKVLNVLNSGEMPPEGEPQLPDEEKITILEDLSKQIVVARKRLADTGGVVTMRRLNRREYQNTIEDLLGVRIDVSDLPSDSNPGGFDTDGSAQFFSSDQFEQYYRLAGEALDAALSFRNERSKTLRTKVEAEVEANKSLQLLEKKIKEPYDRAQQWRASNGKSPKSFGFTDEAEVEFRERGYRQQYPAIREYLDREDTDTGLVTTKMIGGAVSATVKIPARSPYGEYIVRVRVGAFDDAPPEERFVEIGFRRPQTRSDDLDVFDCRQVSASPDDPEELEFILQLNPSDPRSIVLRQRQPTVRGFAARSYLQKVKATGKGPQPALWIDWVELEGPINHAEKRSVSKEVFFDGTRPQIGLQDDYAREIFRRFAHRAFRTRTPTDVYLDQIHNYYSKEISAGASFVDAVKEGLAAIMTSPGFLYLMEPADASDQRRLHDREFAVRLAYFLWSRPPDDLLRQAVSRGELSNPETLRANVRRMLNDKRSDAWVESFAQQWMHMERLDFFQFDPRRFPQFDESVRSAARHQVYQSIRVILDEDRPLSELLNSNYVVVNDLLANYYGISNVKGHHFRKVRVDRDSPRPGLTGMLAIHVMGSDGENSSPVERGAWVLRTLLDDPPPPAPPNVPQLSRFSEKPLSPRDLQSAHMEEVQCAQCHRKIDPIGFGMENFDAAGIWRDKMVIRKNRKRLDVVIDPSGALPNGDAFSNYLELRKLIAGQKESFAKSFTRSLISYALGRPFGIEDEQLLTEITERARENDYRMTELLLAVIESEPFRTKK